LSGFAMLLLGSAALVALAMLVVSPRQVADLLHAAGISAVDFPRILISTVGAHLIFALAMPLAVVVLGVRLIVTRPLLERTVLALAAAMVFVTVAVNVVVVPAIANTLSLKDFTEQAMKVVNDSPVGYLGALNYDVAFYSRRTIPIVSQRDPQIPQYLIAWRTLFDALPATKRDRLEILMTSNPTSLDGTGEMLLLRQRAGSASPPPKPSDDYIQAGHKSGPPSLEGRG
jgi:hypothetical protein